MTSQDVAPPSYVSFHYEPLAAPNREPEDEKVPTYVAFGRKRVRSPPTYAQIAREVCVQKAIAYVADEAPSYIAFGKPVTSGMLGDESADSECEDIAEPLVDPCPEPSFPNTAVLDARKTPPKGQLKFQPTETLPSRTALVFDTCSLLKCEEDVLARLVELGNIIVIPWVVVSELDGHIKGRQPSRSYQDLRRLSDKAKDIRTWISENASFIKLQSRLEVDPRLESVAQNNDDRIVACSYHFKVCYSKCTPPMALFVVTEDKLLSLKIKAEKLQSIDMRQLRSWK